MSRRFVTSLAFVAGLFALAVAQPPGTNQKIDPNADKADPAAKAKKADPTDAAVSAALVNDPDVKVARAKVQLAEAELAKARQAVVLKVMTLTAGIKEYKLAVQAAEDRVAWSARMVEKGLADQRQLIEERAKLESAKAALARVETELKLLTGGTGGGAMGGGGPFDHGLAVWGTSCLACHRMPGGDATAVARGLDWLMKAQEHDDRTITAPLSCLALLSAHQGAHAVKGPVPDRIRAALDKPVKLGAKGEKVTFEKALEVFKKDAGLDVTVRGTLPTRPAYDPKNPNEVQSRPIEIVSEGEELPVGAWFQLFEDSAVFASGRTTTRFRFYVREYGLFIASGELAPPDAPALIDFWKQKPVTAKKEPAPEPKGK
jgi:hypothetical protein